jgi:hypothetical protein
MRWSIEYPNRLVRDDVGSLESVRDLGTVEHYRDDDFFGRWLEGVQRLSG